MAYLKLKKKTNKQQQQQQQQQKTHSIAANLLTLGLSHQRVSSAVLTATV